MIPPPEAIAAAVAEGHVTGRRLDDLTIYNYTPNAQYSGAWTPTVRACRGLIIRDDGVVAARPWDKFFNLGEPCAPAPCASVPHATVKHDGSLGILFAHKRRARWATRGAFDSPQAAAANEMWGDRPASIIPDDWTVLAEIIHPASRVVVRYDFEGLIVLGARRISTGDDVPHAEAEAWARIAGLRFVETVPGDVPSLCRAARDLDDQHEGFVLRWDTPDGPLRLKVKGAAYQRVHRLLSGMTDRRIADLWYFRDRSAFPLLPEEVVATAEESWREMDARAAQLEADVRGDFAALHHDDRKVFALRCTGRVHFGALMSLWQGRPVDFRELAYRAAHGGRPRPMGEE